MASQSLYRKWRSQTFSDLVGQEAVVRTLLNAVRDGRLAHAYLFCGPRGTGKTSTARLLAKAVNCANPHDGEPCNECLSCREITAGHSPDVIEIDAASNTGVDSIRDLRQNVGLAGSGGRYRVYVVDEVHMLSTAAFNALLKTLEEPPSHIIFVLATTEAHKVLPTVVSRCQRFDFRRISMRDIVAHLRHVAEGEGLDLEPAAADLLARAAQGGMRDALSLLDQAMAFCGTHVDLERTRAMLGLADPGALRALIEHVAEQHAAEGLHLINELVTSGADLRQLNAQLSEEWRALVLARAGADVGQLMDRTDDEARDIAALAGRFSLEELTACARVFARNDAPARGLPVPQLALELAFLDCVNIRRNGGALVAPQAQAIPAAAPSVRPAPASAQPAAPARAAQPQSQPQPRPEPSTRPQPPAAPPVEELDLDAIERGSAPPPPPPPTPVRPAPAPAASAPAPALAERPPAPVYETEPAAAGAPTGDLREWLMTAQSKWELVKQVCKQKSRSVAALLHSARPVQLEPGDPVVLVVQADYQFHLDKLRDPKSRQAVEWAVQQVMEMPVRLRLVPANGSGSNGDGPAGPGGAPPTDGAGRGGAGGPAGFAQAAPTPGGGGAGLAAYPSESNVRPFPAGTATRTAAPPSASPPPARAAAPEALPGNVTPFRPPVAPAADIRASRGLEEEVRADAVIQALVRTYGIRLVDVRPLEHDEDR